MLFQRNEVISEHQVYGNRLEEIRIQVVVAQVYELTAITRRKFACALLRGSALAIPGIADVRQSGQISLTHKFLVLLQLRSQGEDRQVQRNQHKRHGQSHDDQNHRFDQLHGCGQRVLYVLLIEFRN